MLLLLFGATGYVVSAFVFVPAAKVVGALLGRVGRGSAPAVPDGARAPAW